MPSRRSFAKSGLAAAAAIAAPGLVRAQSWPRQSIKLVVSAQADAGADVLFAMIDGGRGGAIAACRERGISQIGNVFDWTIREPDVFVASAIADSGFCIEMAARDHLAGALRCGTHRRFGLEMDEVVRLALAPMVGAAARAAVALARAALLRGEVEPATEYVGAEMSLT